MNKIVAAASVVALFGVAGPVAAETDPIALAKQFKGDCPVCHAVDKKVIGPAWRDVANRYRGKKDIIPTLVEKVVKGGSGNWNAVTGGIAMTPHPTTPTRDQIKQIEEAILALAPKP